VDHVKNEKATIKISLSTALKNGDLLIGAPLIEENRFSFYAD
jgi:hypothetical protein